jgi:hypothetical protein
MHPTTAPLVRRVARWPGVDAARSRDGVSFRAGHRHLARLDGDGTLTVPVPPALRDQLLTDGFADRVPGRPDRVRYRVRSAADVPGGIRLLRIAWLHAAGPGRGRGRGRGVERLGRLGASPELVALVAASRGAAGGTDRRPVSDPGARSRGR